MGLLTILLFLLSGLSFASPTPIIVYQDKYTYKSCQSAYDFLALIPSYTLAYNESYNTLEACSAACAPASYQFFAVYLSECHCGTTFLPAFGGSAQDSQCNSTCPGNPMELCGGFMPNVMRGSEWWSLYQLQPSSSSSSSSFSATMMSMGMISTSMSGMVMGTFTTSMVMANTTTMRWSNYSSTTITSPTFIGSPITTMPMDMGNNPTTTPGPGMTGTTIITGIASTRTSTLTSTLSMSSGTGVANGGAVGTSGAVKMGILGFGSGFGITMGVVFYLFLVKLF